MADITIWVLGSIFSILGLLIILGAVKSCHELIQAEREMKCVIDNRTKEFVSAFTEIGENDVSLNDICNQDPV
jgi:hypothetical protein